MRGVLASYQRLRVCNLSVQRRLRGVEIGVGRYFNGDDWVGPIEINQEHKGLLNGDLGPKTGEMGTLMSSAETSGLFDATLGRLRDHLREVELRGDFAINCFVNGDTIYPIEATARFGCPSTYLQSALHRTSWTELLNAIADGRPCDLAVRDGFAGGADYLPVPFMRARDIADVWSGGAPMLLTRYRVTTDEINHLRLEGVALVEGDDGDEKPTKPY